MKQVRMGALVAGLLAIAGMSTYARADTKQHQEKYCAALSALRDDITKLDALGTNATVKELRTATDQIQKDADSVQKEAGKIGTPTSKQFVDSTKKLSNEARSLSDDMTVAQAQSKLAGDIQSVKKNAQALADESGCPEAMPKTQDKGSPPPAGQNPNPSK